MKHVIIGTAGHVDHGKTLLVKALTGIDTDRLVEEKKRGITIELGFAHLDFDDGTQAGIVDVPGHEKFIKNMLAGAGGIDLAMLVVAADEGFMPQTVEHLGILSLLGIQDGLVVITKCDMADPEWVEMVKEDVRTHVEGTFLEGKPVFTVSAYTGQGIPELRQALKELVQKAAEKNMRTPFRLPIDRVFSVDGFGTVVTGTLIEGSVSNGDMAEILPGGVQARVRNLQVHDRDVETAYAGQRVAINLAGVKKADLGRGDVIARPGSVRTSLMLDARLQNLKNSQRTILSGSQVHLYHGSAVRLCKVVLLDRGRPAARRELLRPAPAHRGDRRQAGGPVRHPLLLPPGDHRRRRGPGRPAPAAQAGGSGGAGGPGHPGERLRRRSAGPAGGGARPQPAHPGEAGRPPEPGPGGAGPLPGGAHLRRKGPPAPAGPVSGRVGVRRHLGQLPGPAGAVPQAESPPRRDEGWRSCGRSC